MPFSALKLTLPAPEVASSGPEAMTPKDGAAPVAG
jgi:hypothetical protein